MAKSKYKAYVLPRFDEIFDWALCGLTDKQICNNLKITERDFNLYVNKYKEFNELLVKARTPSIETVEKTLNKLCNGYYYSEEVAQKVKSKEYDDEGNLLLEKEELQKVNIRKYKPPSVSAIQFYLVNKNKKSWASNPHNVDLKNKELKLKEKQSDENVWK